MAVPEAGEEDVLFKVTNLYTGTIDPETNKVVQGLSGARVRVGHEDAPGIEESMTTDHLGEAYFTALPAGRYQVRVTAQNHREYTGRLWFKPGISVTHKVFPVYNLVTVEWSVNEITIEDKYEIPGGLPETLEAKGRVSMERRYYGNALHFEHTRNNLTFVRCSLTGETEIIKKGDIKYKRTSSISSVYVHHAYTITRPATGYRWKDKLGNWIDTPCCFLR